MTYGRIGATLAKDCIQLRRLEGGFTIMNRTAFLAASACVVALGADAASAATVVPGGTKLVERLANFDQTAFNKLLGRPADIRQMWETVAVKPVMWNNLKNAMNGLQFGYGINPKGIAMALADHGPSASYSYSDYVWSKYRIGEFFGIKGLDGKLITRNVWIKATSPYDPDSDPNDEKSMYQDRSIEMLQKRGLVVLACHTAVEEQSRAIVAKGFAPLGMSPTQVADDILTHLIPGAVVVPSMVATVAILQARFHYTYVTLTF